MDTVPMMRTDVTAGAPATTLEFSSLVIESGGTAFIIGLHFSEISKDIMNDKLKKLIKKNM